MKPYYFTFSSNHCTKQGHPLTYAYVVIYAENEGKAREIMYSARKEIWAFSYPEHLFKGQVERFGLYEMGLSEVALY